MRAVETLARFRRDERGAILIFFAISLVVILGFAALAFDLGRTTSTQTELQSYADNLALAAAGELDGDDGAIQRARDAAAQIEADYANNGRFNDLTFLTVDLSNPALTFYASIPADDNAPLTDETDDPAAARYVEVQVAPQGVRMTVMRAFDALRGEERDDPEVGATAVAVYRQLACATVPMFFCMPESGWRAEDNIGQMIKLRSGGGGGAGGGSWEAGNFGFLLPPEGFAADGPCAGKSGAQLRRCFFGAENSVNQCFDQIGVDTSTGQQIGVASRALNVRFDEYPGPISSDDSDYRPAPNVIRGAGDGDGRTMSLPRDECIENDTCGRIGDGNISTERLYEYLARNRGTSDGSYPPFEMRAGTPSTISRDACDPGDDERDCDDPDVLGAFYDQNTRDMIDDWLHDMREQNRAPRYEIYRSEIDAVGPSDDILEQTGDGDFGDKAESGRAVNAPEWSPDPDRRVLVGAGINCNGFTGQTDDLPVEEFVRLFLTERVGASNDPTIYVEVAGSAEKTGSVRDLVELVR